MQDAFFSKFITIQLVLFYQFLPPEKNVVLLKW